MFCVALGATVLGLYHLYVKGEESEAIAGSFVAVLLFAPPSAFSLCSALLWFVGEKAPSLSELDLKLSSSLKWRGRPPGHDEAAHKSGYLCQICFAVQAGLEVAESSSVYVPR